MSKSRCINIERFCIFVIKMTLSCAERAKRFVEKLKKQNRYDEFKRNRKQIYQNYRTSTKKLMSNKQKEEKRFFDKMRTRKHRQKNDSPQKRAYQTSNISSTTTHTLCNASITDENCYNTGVA